MLLVMVNVASALTLNGTINYVPSDANTTFTHYGVSSGIESLSVSNESLTFNAYTKENISIWGYDHGTDKVYFNYDTTSKKLYINVTSTTASLNVSGLQAITQTASGRYDIKRNGIKIESSLYKDSYLTTLEGDYIFQPFSVVSDFGNYSVQYDANTYETEKVSWNITMPDSVGDQFYRMILEDEFGNEYNTTYTVSGLNRTYTADFNIPKNITVDDDIEFWFEGSLFTGGNVQSSHFNTSTIMLDLYNYASTMSCPAGYGLKYYLSFNQENDPASDASITSDVGIEIEYWYGSDGGDLVITENYESVLYENKTFRLCARNSSLPYYMNIYMKYDVPAPQTIDPLSPPLVTTVQECDVGSNCTSNTTTQYTFANETFTQRWYSFGIAGGVHYLYAIMDSSYYQSRELEVYSSLTGKPLSDIYVSMERYYLDTGDWLTVQIDKTDANGRALFYIKDSETDYRFVFSDRDGNSYQVTPIMHFSCPTQFCTTIFYTDPDSVSSVSRPTVLTEIDYNNNSNIIRGRWAVTEGGSVDMKWVVMKNTATGNLVICNSSVSGTSGVDYCDITSHVGVFTAFYTSTYSDEKRIEGSEQFQISSARLHQVLDFEDSILWSSGILLVIILASVFNPLASLISTIVGMIALSLFGMLSALNVSAIIIIGAIVTFISFKVKQK